MITQCNFKIDNLQSETLTLRLNKKHSLSIGGYDDNLNIYKIVSYINNNSDIKSVNVSPYNHGELDLGNFNSEWFNKLVYSILNKCNINVLIIKEGINDIKLFIHVEDSIINSKMNLYVDLNYIVSFSGNILSLNTINLCRFIEEEDINCMYTFRANGIADRFCIMYEARRSQCQDKKCTIITDISEDNIDTCIQYANYYDDFLGAFFFAIRLLINHITYDDSLFSLNEQYVFYNNLINLSYLCCLTIENKNKILELCREMMHKKYEEIIYIMGYKNIYSTTLGRSTFYEYCFKQIVNIYEKLGSYGHIIDSKIISLDFFTSGLSQIHSEILDYVDLECRKYSRFYVTWNNLKLLKISNQDIVSDMRNRIVFGKREPYVYNYQTMSF